MSRVWRGIVDRLKHSQRVLEVADRLGRSRGRIRVLDDLVDPPMPHRPDLRALAASEFGACWIGHATLLFRVAGRWILTDPVWSNRVGLGLGPLTLGPRRLVAPAVPLSRLPKIDIVLLSHAHFDHLDLPTLHHIARHRPLVVAADGTTDLLRGLAFQDVRELAIGKTIDVLGVRVTAMPVRHWTARTFFDTWREACAFVVETASRRILFAGDTAMSDSFAGTGPYDLAAFGIGAYDPFVSSHATPEQVWAMAESADVKQLASMHHATFRLSVEPTAEPLQRLLKAAGPSRDRVVLRRPGDAWGIGRGKNGITSLGDW